MWDFLVLISFILTGGLHGLGDDRYLDREAASARLHGLGLVAVPVLLDGAQSEDFEVSQRCRVLLSREATFRRIIRFRQGVALYTQAWRLFYEGDNLFASESQQDEIIAGGNDLQNALVQYAAKIFPRDKPIISQYVYGYEGTIGYVHVLRHWIRLTKFPDENQGEVMKPAIPR